MQSSLQTDRRFPPVNRRRDWRVWWRLTRPHTLTAAFVPVSIGTALAFHETNIRISLFIAMLVASLFIQAATNMFNEYYDFKRGLDSPESVGIGGAIVREGIHPKAVLYLAIFLFAIAMLIGVYICVNSSWWLALIGSICMAAGYFYTGGPVPIAYTPFGELAAGFFMGLVIILISFFIQTGEVTKTAILISVPIAILVGAILLANNIRDLDGDKENGRKTLAILVGRNNAIRILAGMFAISFIWMIGLVLFHLVSVWTLLVFFSVPKAITATKGFIGKTKPIEMMPAMKATAQTNTQFGFLLAIGLLISYWL
ncbi:1,4-dihydroxy-2-naphthoate polyprenyltransferase [Parageobacillus toebii NBRC 107807]|uniref:1,4-dihydroxy-2-naphthoate octaprenyltransferase n=1 Tax=Parageobacillus toebii NBRC 107807 TaxID=1223503 RepID=A0A6G9J0J5_9BACL|nr:1,4-dihydroxy-2-naphthoate polyprenyltransferase [Parageobacillus toebii]MBB3869617.1 1,4-dihydroxy-2-naphthoate octaprenyltransferase [Parageobacillus toebii NBRC 107807]MED4969301.1 1,4-dihydroxy-2-naphthoate polyprenyltransferase [Parageobacillus toebii]QIQ31767.1 1,4-dihydroxy-2-naphthoate polyprenyltransferase [Parageobacillus toebii NBRC 107807]QSB49703.1 1,4-dihydroxy-2-naphthoate polyprenyltransferase [Parageobacillus toebii]WMT19561.1 1,4-dihydroxy-2-naphthoate polyprenyltransferas